MSELQNRLQALISDFNSYAKKNNISEPQPLDLIEFLQAQGFTASEIEDVFAGVGYPINMDNIDALEAASSGEDGDTVLKKKAVAEITERIDKNMNKTMRRALADVLLDFYKHKEPTKKSKPKVRRNKETGEWEEVEESLRDSDATFLFESKSTLFEGFVTSVDARKILNAAYDTGKLEVSRSGLLNMWKNDYSKSTNIEDLNELLKKAGLRFYAANRISSKLKIPQIKDYELEYVESMAQIAVEYDVVGEVLEYLKTEYKMKLKENALVDVLKSAAIVDTQDGGGEAESQDFSQEDQQELVRWTQEWLQKIPMLQNREQHASHLELAVNVLADIYQTQPWHAMREHILKAINNLQVDRNDIQNSIRHIDSGQKIQIMSESKIKQLFAEIILKETNEYMR